MFTHWSILVRAWEHTRTHSNNVVVFLLGNFDLTSVFLSLQ
jgi:hypothetical protein